MTAMFRISMLGASLLLAVPALAQNEAHADQHPAVAMPAPAASPTPVAAPAPAMAMDMAPAKATAHDGMMAGGEMMTPAMMRECHRRMMRHHHRAATHKHRH